MQTTLAQEGDDLALRERKLSQFDVLQSHDAAMLGSGKVIWALCTANMAVLRDGRQLSSSFLLVNGGMNIDTYLTTRWIEHSESAMHRICSEHADDLKRDSMTHATSAALAREDAVLERLFNTAMFVCELPHQPREDTRAHWTSKGFPQLACFWHIQQCANPRARCRPPCVDMAQRRAHERHDCWLD